MKAFCSSLTSWLPHDNPFVKYSDLRFVDILDWLENTAVNCAHHPWVMYFGISIVDGYEDMKCGKRERKRVLAETTTNIPRSALSAVSLARSLHPSFHMVDVAGAHHEKSSDFSWCFTKSPLCPRIKLVFQTLTYQDIQKQRDGSLEGKPQRERSDTFHHLTCVNCFLHHWEMMGQVIRLQP